MVIDTNNGIKPGTTATNTGRSSNVPAKDGGPQTESRGAERQTPQDSVVLSQEAQSMNRLGDSIANLPDIDSERVETIKQAIAEGRFEFDAERIAENMLNQDDLLG